MTDVYKLHIRCPLCNKAGGMRVVVEEDEDTRVICTKCKDLDEVVTEDDAWSCLSAITEVIEHEELDDIIVEKLHMEE